MATSRSGFHRTPLLFISLGRRTLATHAAAEPTRLSAPQTFIEKIAQRYAVDVPPGKAVRAGDYISLKPEYVMTHDNTAPVISKFRSIGASRIAQPSQAVFCIDHDVQNKSPANLRKYANIEKFAHEQGVDFYPPGRGIGHQVMVEEGYAFPGGLMVASDSHSNMYGGVACVGTPVVRTDAASIWATGRTWWQVPPIVRVELKGRLAPGVTGKDIIVALCGSFNQDEVLNCAIEFVGEGVSALSIDERLAVANMTTEWGALAGVFPVDEALVTWYEAMLKRRELSAFLKGPSSAPATTRDHPRLSDDRIAGIRAAAVALSPDSDATYSKTLTLDLATLVPHVSGPNSVKISTDLPTLSSQNVAINKAYLVSCTNSRASDIASAAEVVRGRRVAPGVEFYVAAASSVVQAETEASGDWGALVAAGAKVLPAGCGPCIGLGTGLLEDGEVGISATNRNYKGRMGSPKAQAYLASPAVVAASAVAGRICGPEEVMLGASPFAPSKPAFAMHASEASPAAVTPAPSAAEDLLPAFPPLFSGPLLFAPQDNINTDGIYPGKYTYQDDITPQQQADVVMENYDPSFAATVAALAPASFSTSPSPPAQEMAESLPTPEGKTARGAEASRTGRGVVLASGYNFGTGSSREQAATAIRNSGVPLVICGSFGDIFKRNSINNGLICLEAPEMIADLTREFGKDGKRGAGGREGELTVSTFWDIEVSSADGSIKVVVRDRDGAEVERRSYKTQAVGRSVQEMPVLLSPSRASGADPPRRFLAGGLEGWVRERLPASA